MRPQDSIAVRHRSTQLLAIKEQLRSKVEALKRELETKRKSTSRGGDLDDGNGDSEPGLRDRSLNAMGMGGKLFFIILGIGI